MSVKLRIAGMLAVVVIGGLAMLDANACACGPDWSSLSTEEIVQRVNQMSDQSRYYAGDNGYLPSLDGSGYMYAEDYSVVPDTYYDPTAIETSTPGCFVFYVDQPNVSEELVDYLFDRGWSGDPTDGQEALYSPTCW